MVARSSYRIYPKGVRLASGYPVEKGGVVTGRLHSVGWVSRDRIGGFDLKRFWMRCMMCLFVYLELQLECVIGLVIPSVMLYPYRCSWMRSTFIHHLYLSKFTLYMQSMLHVRIDSLD